MGLHDLECVSALVDGVLTACIIVTNLLICVCSSTFNRVPSLPDPATYQNDRKAATDMFRRHNNKPGLTDVKEAKVKTGMAKHALVHHVLTSYAQVLALLACLANQCELCSICLECLRVSYILRYIKTEFKHMLPHTLKCF